MRRVYIVCEGQTEETFVRDVLWEPFGSLGLNLIGQTIETSVGHKGGALSYARVGRHLHHLFRQRGEFFVTTLFDLYRLDGGFPGFVVARQQNGLDRCVAALTAAFHADVIQSTGCRAERFIPHIQPHEFEALLFSDVPTLASSEPGWTGKQPVLQAVRDAVATPEDINERPGNNPAAHLERELANPRYKKVLHGPRVTKEIGLARIEAECAFFARWLEQLRALA